MRSVIRGIYKFITSSHERSDGELYLVPAILILLIVVVQLLLRTFISENTFHLLPLIIIISAWYGGARSGIFSTVLVALLDMFLFLPAGESYFTLYNVVSTGILALGGIFISLISEVRRKVDRQKDEFIGFAGHELRNPLATIMGYAHLLKNGSSRMSPGKIRSIAGTIESQSKRANDLISELLDVTKIGAGKFVLHKERLDLTSFLQEIIRDQRMLFPSHVFVLKGRTKCTVYADKYRIGQVLINLLTNAVKYSPGAKKVVVGLKVSRQEIIVSVQDFGKGIAEENLDKVFDQYFRERTASQRKTQGLGLGLYISREIVKQHNGKLWVESTEGKGTTFYLALNAR